MGKVDEAVKYFEKQRRMFLRGAKNIDNDFDKDLEYLGVAIKALKAQSKKEDDGELTERFERFWKSYPKKLSRVTALKAFGKIRPDEKLLKTIITAVDIQKNSNQWIVEEGKYIPHAATWLNGKRWEDSENEGDSEMDWISATRKSVPVFKG